MLSQLVLCVEVVRVADQELRNLDDIVEAAIRLFHADKSLTTWSAVERVLDGIEQRHLVAIYRASRQAWCAEALAAGGDALIGYGIEKIGLQLRKRAQIRNQDDLRSRPRPNRPKRDSRPRGRR